VQNHDAERRATKFAVPTLKSSVGNILVDAIFATVDFDDACSYANVGYESRFQPPPHLCKIACFELFSLFGSELHPSKRCPF